jgi:hypothetical protein
MSPFADRGVSRGRRGGSPTVVNLSFLDRSRYFSLKQLLTYPHEAKCTPFQAHYFSENLVTPGIEHRTSGLAARNSDHKITEAIWGVNIYQIIIIIIIIIIIVGPQLYAANT